MLRPSAGSGQAGIKDLRQEAKTQRRQEIQMKFSWRHGVLALLAQSLPLAAMTFATQCNCQAMHLQPNDSFFDSKGFMDGRDRSSRDIELSRKTVAQRRALSRGKNQTFGSDIPPRRHKPRPPRRSRCKGLSQSCEWP